MLLILLIYMDTKFGEVEIRHAMLASLNKRFINFIIDTVIIYASLYLLDWIATLCYDQGYEGLLVWMYELSNIQYTLFSILVSIMYHGLMETFTMRTLGKYITNTKVVLRDGSKPNAKTILIRTLCREIPLDPLSYLNKSIGWHDSLSKTLVINVKIYEDALLLKNSFEEIGQHQETL